MNDAANPPVGHAADVVLNDVASADPHRAALLLVHGAYHGAWCWEDWIARWTDAGFPVAALDLPGRDSATRPAGFADMGVVAMADSVVATAISLDRPLIGVGHSLGALILAKAAEQIRFEALALLAPSPPGNLKSGRSVSPKPDGIAVNPPSRADYERLYLGGAKDQGGHHGRLCAESAAALNDRYRLSVPVRRWVASDGLVVEAGREDPVRHPPGQDRAIADHFGFTHHLLEDASHCMMLDRDDKSAFDLVLRWLRDRTHLAASSLRA